MLEVIGYLATCLMLGAVVLCLHIINTDAKARRRR